MSGEARAALVTGGGQGLGAAIVRSLHAAGYGVAIGDLDIAAADAVARELGDGTLALRLDVRDEASFAAALDAMVARWGAAHVLVNNAALTAARPVLEISADEFDAVTAVNLRGTFIGSQRFGRYFKERRDGRIVNIASLAGQNGGTATGAHYAASKGGILTLTKVFARDLAPYGVTVNAIAPGPLDLPSVRALVPADRLDALVAGIPAARLGDPAFIGDMVVMLASAAAASVTGATWDANGGLLMR